MNKLLLFSATWCVNCPNAKKKLDALGIEYEIIDVVQYPLVVKEYGVKAIPTVVITNNTSEIVLYQSTGNSISYEKVKELMSA